MTRCWEKQGFYIFEKTFQEKITAIGSVVYTEECADKISAARAAYNALTEAQKALVTNYSTLTEAETTYEELAPAGTIVWNTDFCADIKAYKSKEGIVTENNSKDGITVDFAGTYKDDGIRGCYLSFMGSSESVTFSSTVYTIAQIEIKYTSTHGYMPAGWTKDETNQIIRWEGTPADAVVMNSDDYLEITITRIVFTVKDKGPTTGVEEAPSDPVPSTKVLRNGVLLIERDGKMYNPIGQQFRLQYMFTPHSTRVCQND